MSCSKILLKYALSILLLCSIQSFAQVTLKALTDNNSSACPASGVLPIHCQQAFVGQTDTRSGVATAQFDRPAGNVSGEDIHGYLVQGSKTRIFVNFMLGFCVDSHAVLCNNNVQTGYTANSVNTVAAQAEDLRRRHIDGAIMTWEGAGSNEDKATLAFQSYVNATHCSGPQMCDPTYIIMYDGPSLAYNLRSTGIPGTSGAGCSTAPGSTDLTVFRAVYENCVIAHIRNDMCYMNGTHWGNDAYEKSGGRPIVQVFPNENVLPATGGDPSWSHVWQNIETWNSDLQRNCMFAPYSANNGVPLIIFENVGGFTHDASSGSFYWIQPATGITNQFTSNISPFSTSGTLDDFYQTAQAYPGKKTWGAAFKGFNDIQSPWGRNRVMDQQCGQTWVSSLKEINGYAASPAAPFLQVVTWNDYNEGSEIESGIDNCYVISAQIVGITLNWALNPTNKALASLTTVSHVEIYDSPDGLNLKLIASVPAGSNGTYSLETLPRGTHYLFTRMVGKNSILNRISSGARFVK
jgi:hypothetical protein